MESLENLPRQLRGLDSTRAKCSYYVLISMQPGTLFPVSSHVETVADDEVAALLAANDETSMPPMMPYAFGAGSYFYMIL
jgi:hypothetical protein